MRIASTVVTSMLAVTAVACVGELDGGGAPGFDDRPADDRSRTADSATIEPAVYTLVRSGSDKCLDGGGALRAGGSFLSQEPCGDRLSQAFRIEPVDGDGRYRLISSSGDGCVDTSAGTVNGTPLRLRACRDDATGQAFRIASTGDGTHRLVDVASERCIDVRRGSTAGGAPVQLWTCNRSDAQRWALTTPTAPAWGGGVLSLYSFQDNAACNSVMTSSGRPLVPYVSVSVPYRTVQGLGGGPFVLGDEVHVSFLHGRLMPNGRPHTGWVRIDDVCGDHDDDSACFHDGKPVIELYIGDWATSGMTCQADDRQAPATGTVDGPGGNGREATEVRFGPAPPGAVPDSYGSRAMGDGNCGDCDAGKTVQPPACWYDEPGIAGAEYCSCDNSNGSSGECLVIVEPEPPTQPAPP